MNFHQKTEEVFLQIGKPAQKLDLVTPAAPKNCTVQQLYLMQLTSVTERVQMALPVDSCASICLPSFDYLLFPCLHVFRNVNKCQGNVKSWFCQATLLVEHWPALIIPSFSKCPGTLNSPEDDSIRLSSSEVSESLYMLDKSILNAKAFG